MLDNPAGIIVREISKKEGVEVSVRVRNSGNLEGAEIIQLYISDSECSVERPVKELKGFDKIYLKAGESKEISFKLKPQDFAFWHPETKEWTIESGKFEIIIGASSKDIRQSTIISVK